MRTGLPDESATKVYGEAMLTMQSARQKTDIIREAYRLLKKGGLYGIHEIALTAEGSDPAIRQQIYREMQGAILSNVAPLPTAEWEQLLKDEGFAVRKVITNPMHLLEPKRVIDDEGFFRTLRILFNILTHPAAAKRIRGMRRIFRRHEGRIMAIAIIAEKV